MAIFVGDFHLPGVSASVWCRENRGSTNTVDAFVHTGYWISVSRGSCIQLALDHSNSDCFVFLDENTMDAVHSVRSCSITTIASILSILCFSNSGCAGASSVWCLENWASICQSWFHLIFSLYNPQLSVSRMLEFREHILRVRPETLFNFPIFVLQLTNRFLPSFVSLLVVSFCSAGPGNLLVVKW